jgi:hypothetical protein
VTGVGSDVVKLDGVDHEVQWITYNQTSYLYILMVRAFRSSSRSQDRIPRPYRHPGPSTSHSLAFQQNFTSEVSKYR